MTSTNKAAPHIFPKISISFFFPKIPADDNFFFTHCVVKSVKSNLFVSSDIWQKRKTRHRTIWQKANLFVCKKLLLIICKARSSNNNISSISILLNNVYCHKTLFKKCSDEQQYFVNDGTVMTK